MSLPSGTLTESGELLACAATTLPVPLLSRHSIHVLYSPRFVLVAVVSLTVCWPASTIFSPVVPPSPTAEASIELSTSRLKRPGLLAGRRTLRNSNLPVLAR